MECLNALRQARAGNYEEIENFRKMAANIAVAARNPVTREMVEAKKLNYQKTTRNTRQYCKTKLCRALLKQPRTQFISLHVNR